MNCPSAYIDYIYPSQRKTTVSAFFKSNEASKWGVFRVFVTGPKKNNSTRINRLIKKV
jgi:hypothetical protein